MAARRRYFPGKDILWLEEKLDAALEERGSGLMLTNWSEGDTTAGSQMMSSTDERIRMLSNDLSQLDPGKYPAEEVTPVSRTRPNFSGISPVGS